MLTAVILAERDPENLAATLGALVPAVVEGLLGDAVVVARLADPAVANIAEIAGASLAVAPGDADPWREGGRLARRDWLLCLRAGDVPADGWMRAVDHFLVASARDRRPLGRFSRARVRSRRLILSGRRAHGRDALRPPRRPRSAQLARRP